MSISQKILNVDRRIIWLIMLILLAYPMINPIGLPIGVDPFPQAFYDTIENLPPGAVVLQCYEHDAGHIGELVPQAVTTLQHLFDKDVKIINIVFYRADVATVYEEYVLPYVDQRGAEYGVDYVNIGFVQGMEAAMAAFAEDFTFPVKDQYGSLLEDMPLIQEVQTMRDVDLVIMQSAMDQEIRQFCVPYDVPGLVGIIPFSLPEMMNYYDAGIVVGILAGLPAAAQYEYLAGYPAKAILGMDAITLSHLFLIALIIVVNITSILTREGEKT
jgi:hypothetical protein